MNVIYLDIETYRTTDTARLREIAHDAVSRRPAQNVAKAIKEEWDTDEARQERADEAIAKTALDPLLAEVLCVASAVDDGAVQAFSAMRESEKGMLEELAEAWKSISTPETAWCAHNGEGFDLKILLNRFRKHKIQPPPSFPRFYKGKLYGRIADTMLSVPCSNGLGMVSLADACRAYDLPVPKTSVALEDGRPLSGSLVGFAYESGQHAAIMRYCAEDVETTRRLYKRITFDGKCSPWEASAELDQEIADIWNSPLARETKLALVLERCAAHGRIPARYLESTKAA